MWWLEQAAWEESNLSECFPVAPPGAEESEVLPQAIGRVKDSVLPLACVHCFPWVLPFLQADGHCRHPRGKAERGSSVFIFKQ